MTSSPVLFGWFSVLGVCVRCSFLFFEQGVPGTTQVWHYQRHLHRCVRSTPDAELTYLREVGSMF